MRMYMAHNSTPRAVSLASQPNLKPIGYHTAHICEATDAAYSTAAAVDGQSGDTDYPFGDIKVLATVGEYDPKSGYMLVGVPDGMGAYLKDKDTVRVIFQSESCALPERAVPNRVNSHADAPMHPELLLHSQTVPSTGGAAPRRAATRTLSS